MTSSEGASSSNASACVAWKSLVRRSFEAWSPPRKPTDAFEESALRNYTDLDDFLAKSTSGGTLMFWFFQRRDVFLSQRTMTKWSRDRLDDYVLFPSSTGFVTRNECFFVSHFWDSPDNPDPDGKYLQLMQADLRMQPWSYIWVDWTCLPQEPRSEAENGYFLRGLQTMSGIIRNCGFMWWYPPFDARMWILFEVAEYTLTCVLEIARHQDIEKFLDHVKEMSEIGVRATLTKHGYKCKRDRDREFMIPWLELLVLLKGLLSDVDDIKKILDVLTWNRAEESEYINTADGLVILHRFEGTLFLREKHYRFTPFPRWVSFRRP